MSKKNIYQEMIGKYKINKIYNEDSYVAIKDIPSKTIDLIVTDPPYKIENTNAGGNNDFSRNGKKTIQRMNNELAASKITQGINMSILKEFVRIMKNINIYIFCNHKQIPDYLEFFVKKHNCNFDILIWHKSNAMPLFNNKYLTDKEYCLYFRKNAYCNPLNYEDASTVFFGKINHHDKNIFLHPTIKPLELVKKLIRNSSKEGDVVFDAFTGSGTTAIAAKELNRNYLGFELEEKWHKVAIDRLNGITAKGQYSLF